MNQSKTSGVAMTDTTNPLREMQELMNFAREETKRQNSYTPYMTRFDALVHSRLARTVSALTDAGLQWEATDLLKHFGKTK